MQFLWILTVLMSFAVMVNTWPTADKRTHLPTLDDVSVDETENSGSAKSLQVQKRSGSTDYILQFKSGLLSTLGHASASAASSSSHGSSGHAYKFPTDEHHSNSVEYDPWSLKKSVLNTIFQAVKAITGGVTALKGQLIKGSGYALKASGHVVAASGDKVTDFGRVIINSAHSKIQHSGGSNVHPFSKFISFSGGSAGAAKQPSSGGHTNIHTETITTYEIPSGHSNYGPPLRPTTLSSATHGYLPPSGVGGSSTSSAGGGTYSIYGGHGAHAAFESPSHNYLPSGYGLDGLDDFSVFRGNNNLTDSEKEKAITQLQEILSLLPLSETDNTNDWNPSSVTAGYSLTGPSAHTVVSGSGPNTQTTIKELPFFYIPKSLGPLQALPQAIKDVSTSMALNTNSNSGAIYQQMQKQQQQQQYKSPEEVYLSKHPEEVYDYYPTPTIATNSNNKPDNYHASSISQTNAINATKIPLETLVPPLKTKTKTKTITSSNASTGKNPTTTHSKKTNTNTISLSSAVSGHALPFKTRTRYIIYPPVTSQYLPLKPAKTAEPFKVQRMDKFAVLNKDKSYDFENFNSLLYSAGMTTDL